MSAPDAPQFDEARIVQVLDRHGVAYVLVGGLGALLHGASRPTLDFDLCAAWDLDNLGRLVDALRELGAELRVRPGVQPPTVDAHLLHDKCRDDVADSRRRHRRTGRDPVQPPGRPAWPGQHLDTAGIGQVPVRGLAQIAVRFWAPPSCSCTCPELPDRHAWGRGRPGLIN